MDEIPENFEPLDNDEAISLERLFIEKWCGFMLKEIDDDLAKLPGLPLIDQLRAQGTSSWTPISHSTNTRPRPASGTCSSRRKTRPGGVRGGLPVSTVPATGSDRRKGISVTRASRASGHDRVSLHGTTRYASEHGRNHHRAGR